MQQGRILILPVGDIKWFLVIDEKQQKRRTEFSCSYTVLGLLSQKDAHKHSLSQLKAIVLFRNLNDHCLLRLTGKSLKFPAFMNKWN